MSIDTTTLAGLSKLMLVACDMSYKGNSASVNEDLAPHRDTPTYDFLPPYDVTGNGFRVFASGEVSATGFKFVTFKKGGELIVAMGGTDGPSMQDWAGNMRLGWDQWNGAIDTATNGVVLGTSGRDGLFATIEQFLSALPLDQRQTATIHFTGQSLGGALAEYAAYEWVKLRGNAASNISLTTFNGLGSKQGLVTFGNQRQADVDAFGGLGHVAHYFVTNDLVSRLGGGHIAAGGNTYEFKFASNEIDARTGRPYLLDPVTAHRIETGFYKQFANSNDPENVFNEATPSSPNLIVAGRAVSVAAQLIGLFNSKGTTELSAKYRALSGLTAAISQARGSSDLESILDPIIDSLRDSNLIDSGLVSFLRARGAGELKRAAEHFQYLAVTQMLTALVLERAASATTPNQSEVLALRQLLSADVVNSDLNTAFYGLPFFQRAAAILAGLDLIDPNSPRWGAADRQALARLGIDPQEVTRSLFSGASDVELTRSDPFNYLAGRVIRNGQLWDGLKAWFQLNKAFKGATSDLDRIYRPWLVPDGLILASFDEAITALKAESVAHFRAVGEVIANASPEFTNRFTDLSFNFDQRFSSSDYKNILQAVEEVAKDVTLRSTMRDEILTVKDIVEFAGERPLLSAVDSGLVNPFNDRNFDPDSTSLPSSSIAEGRTRAFLAHLPYAARLGGQRIHVRISGAGAESLDIVRGSDVVTLDSNGEFDLTVSEGTRQVAFAVVQVRDVDNDSALILSATLVDGAGNPTHLTHDQATLTLEAHEELAPQITFSGGAGSDAYTQSERDYTGQRVSISGGDGADLIGGAAGEDTLDGGAGGDIIIGVGGEDAISGGEGNDLITVSGEGAAHIDGGPGDDVVDALRLIDGHVLPIDGGSFFGWRGVAPDILPHLHASLRGDPRGNRADNAVNGLPYAIGLNPASFSGTSSEIGLSGGQLAVTPGGGASYSVTPGDRDNWLVTYTAGAQSRTFDLSFGLVGVAQNGSGVSVDGGDGNDLLIGSLGEDFVRGGTGNDVVAGHDGDDVVLGDAGTDAVFGGEGNDFLDGGADDDVLFGESGNDALYGGDGADHLEGDGAGTPLDQQGDDYLNGEGGDDELIGERGIDVLIGGDGSDRLYGGDGSDELVGGTGNDLLQGGDGNDNLDAGADNDVLFGEAGDDSLSGREGYDQVSGGEGNDLLEGGAGGDFLAGDGGNDTLYGDEGADQLHGSSGDDTLVGGLDDDLLDGGDGSDRIEGDAGNDILRGGAGNDTYVFSRGDGTDTFDDPDTGADASVLVLGPGITRNDLQLQRGSLVLDFGQGDAIHIEGFDAQDPGAVPLLDRLEFSDGTTLEWNDLLRQGFDLPGSDASEYILGTTFTDRIDALGGDDTVTALSGDDKVDAGAGDDFVFAGTGNDTVVGGSGNDYVELDVGDDEAEGGEGADFIAGGPGNDTEHGDAGDDSLSGNEGEDVLVGGTGDDDLRGGPGADAYVLARGDGRDSISDSSDGNTLEFLSGNTDALGVAQVTVTARHDNSGTLSIVADYGGSAGSDVVTVLDPFTAIASVRFKNADTDETETLTLAQFIEGANTPSVDLAGTDSDDILDGGFAGDRLDGGMGDDALYGLWGDDQVRGGIGDDRAYADRGDDWLAGEAGDDLLEGGDGNDILAGGIGTNRLYGGPGSDQYVLEDGSMQLIEEDATPGIETIRLAPGRSMANLRAYRAGDDLALDDLEGAGQAYVKGFFGSPPSKTWVLAGDLEAPRDLRAFVAAQLAGAGDDFTARSKAFEIGLRGDLALRGARGESLGGLSDYRGLIGWQYLDYRFTGVTLDAVAASGGMILLPRSESESSETHTVEYTWTSQVPLYTVQIQPGASRDVMPPPGTGGIVYPAGTSVSQNPDGSLHLQEPAMNRAVPSGVATITHSFTAFATQVERSFTIHHVVGSDAPERFVMVTDFDEGGNFYPAGPKSFRGSIAAGGGDDVIFTPMVGDDDHGWDYSLLTPHGRGALIDGGAGNDVIGGTNGADEILLGEGDDLVDGGAGADTYYAPFSGGGTDVVHDSAHPSSLTLMYGGLPPEDVMALAPGVTLDNLRYRMTDGRTPAVTDDFHRYGFFSTLEAVPPASALRTLEIEWGTDTKLLVVDSRTSGGVWGGIGIERYRFADGTSLSREQFLAQVTRIENPVVEAGPGDEVLRGTPGDDTFVIVAGSGVDRITPSGGFDTLAFGDGIEAANVSLDLGSLLLHLDASGDAVHIEGFDPDHALEPGSISRFVFADGSEFTHAELVARGFDLFGAAGSDTIHGTSVHDRIRGGKGADRLVGGAGDDWYYFEVGDGADQIVDSSGFDALLLGVDLSADAMTVRRTADGVRLEFAGGDSVGIGRDVDGQLAIDWVQFADGSAWDAATLEMHVIPNGAPTAGDDGVELSEDGVLEVFGNALANDSDPDVDARLTVAGPGDFFGTYGTLSLAADGLFKYVLKNGDQVVQALRDGEVVGDPFGYVVTDGIDSASATIRVSVAGANDAPVTAPDSAAVSEDMLPSAVGNVLTNDKDADADTALSVEAKAVSGTYGTLALDANGAYRYTLAGSATVQSLREGQTVTDVLGYLATDGIAATAGTLSVSVLGMNDAPTLAHPIADQRAQVGSAFSLAPPETTFIDVDQGDVLAYAARRADGTPLPAWLAFNPATRTFSGTPGVADSGTLQVRLTALDLAGASAHDVFSVTIAGGASRTFDFQKSGAWPVCDDDDHGRQHGGRGHDDEDCPSERTNVGSPGKPGTGDEVSIEGKNRSRIVYAGGGGVDTLNGTSGADALLLDDETSPRLLSIEMINMGAGDDVVDLTSRRYVYGDVTLNGGAGKDVLWANAGDDILDGGAGDDTLAGGAGNDVYVHGAGGGGDVITETAGQDVLRFGNGIAPNAVTVSRHEKDLVLSAGANGRVTVRNWFGAGASRVERVQFADGTVWNEAQLTMRANAGSSGHGESYSGGGSEVPHSGGDGAAHGRDDPSKESSDPKDKPTVNDAADAIAALLGKQPSYEFNAVADYLSKHYDDRAGDRLSTAEIALQWRTLQRYAAGLAHMDPNAAEAAQGRGFADDLLRVAAAAMGWGYEGSTGVARPAAGMNALQGLSEGFQRLR